MMRYYLASPSLSINMSRITAEFNGFTHLSDGKHYQKHETFATNTLIRVRWNGRIFELNCDFIER